MWALRIAIGLIFAVSGFEKATGPIGNFLYVIQQYQVLPTVLAKMVAATFPWLEFVAGVFLVLGLWTPVMLWASAGISAVFMCLVGQAIIRQLPIDNCGCFGELLHLPLTVVIFVDIAMLIAALLCLRSLGQSSRVSIDGLFANKK